MILSAEDRDRVLDVTDLRRRSVRSSDAMAHGTMVKTEEVLCDSNANFELDATSYFHPRPRGLVVLVHSLQERIGQYEHLVKAIWEAEFSVYLFNWRRQRRDSDSSSPFVFVANPEELLEDLRLAIEQARCREDNRKVFVIGHDFGASVVALYCTNVASQEVTGIALFSPAMKPPLLDSCIGVCAPLLGILRPRWKVTMERKGTLEEGYLRTFRCCVQLVGALSSKVKDLKLPLLILCGAGDSTEELNSAEYLYRAAGSDDKGLVYFEGRSDDLWMDIDEAPEAITNVVNWLTDRTNP